MSLPNAPVTLALSTLVVSLALAACGGEVSPETPSVASGEHPADVSVDMSSDGLTVDEATEDRASGRFVRDGVAIRFAFARDGETRSARILRDSGEPLIETTLVDGVDSSSYFGGKATVRGFVNSEPTDRTGNESVFEELKTSPEVSLVPALKEALLASHRVNEDLFRKAASKVERAGAILPQSVGDGVWRIVNRSVSYGFFSWSFWGTTTVIAGDYLDWWNGPYAVSLQAGLAPAQIQSGRGHNIYGRQWWGAWVTIQASSRNTELCGVVDPNCQYRDWMWVYAY